MSKKGNYIGGSTVIRSQWHKFGGLPPLQRVGYLEATATSDPSKFVGKTRVVRAEVAAETPTTRPKSLWLQQEELIRQNKEEERAKRLAKRLQNPKAPVMSNNAEASLKRRGKVVVERRSRPPIKPG